ncbi:hypothetical protein, partial [Halomonas sp. KM-1]|uniref:hypothetical protein n=1 Tax=Halomonas sp. KM-1 TaxID=590061 RepID=UPI001EE63C07
SSPGGGDGSHHDASAPFERWRRGMYGIADTVHDFLNQQRICREKWKLSVHTEPNLSSGMSSQSVA